MTTPTPSSSAAAGSAYRLGTLALATASANSLAVLLAAPLPTGVLVAAGARALTTAAARATSLADLSLAAALGAAPLGLLVPDTTTAHATTALTTLLHDGGVPVLDGDGRALRLPDDPATVAAVQARAEAVGPRVERLARATSLDAGRDAYTRAMVRRSVPGWVRVTGPAPCPLCRELGQRGDVLPASFRMAKHAGCSCTARPVTTTPTAGRMA